MFWGLIMEPGKKYSQVVEKDFHIAQAALDLDSAQDSPVQVLISIDGRNYLVCTLIKDKICQANIDLNFRAGVKVSFATNGPGHVHLTGYLIEEDEFMMEEESDDDEEVPEAVKISSNNKRKAQQFLDKPNKKTKTAMLLDQLDEESYNEEDDSNVNSDLMDSSDDSDDESGAEEEEDDAEGEEDEVEGSDDDDDDDDESGEVDSSSNEDEVFVSKKQESPQQNGIQKKTPKGQKVQVSKSDDKTPKGPKTPKHDQQKTPKHEKTPKHDQQKSPKQHDQQKSPKHDQQKTPKNDQQKQKTPKGKSPGESNTPVKKTVEGGVVIEDLKVGEGQVAKSGRTVRVFYEGRLKSTNKLFDSSTKGIGFKFRLGKQEVIKGWDIGVAGMKVGGKRRIICPPNMAYGNAGSPPVIPPNSALIFDVELKQVQ